MGRKQREVSETGFYHVTQRGNAHAIIFEGDDDRRQFLRLLKRYRDEFGFRVIAWCLMDDHFHLVVDTLELDLSDVMHRIERSYVHHFNSVHGREGHLFQGAFRSKPILTERQLVATARYVHANPEKAGICPAVQHRWSSLQEYLGKHYLVDTSVLLELCGGVEGLLPCDDDYEYVVLSEGGRRNMTDDEAVAVAKDLMGEDALRQLQSADVKARNQAVRALANNGVSSRQISRLAALGRGTVDKILSEREGTHDTPLR